MALAIVYSRAQSGVDAPTVIVEVHLANGLPGLSVVGLPEAAVREAKDRVRSAIQNAGFEFPARRITINLAPADLPKEGGRFDLPMAVGILVASGQCPGDELEHLEFIGELALNGTLRPVRGALTTAAQTLHHGRKLMLPRDNAAEAALVQELDVLGAAHLLEVSAHLHGQQRLQAFFAPNPVHTRNNAHGRDAPDLRDVRGQSRAKRALEVAAAGGHSLLMVGPPGSGKTMLASRLPGILPPMSDAEALQAAAVQSVSDRGFRAETWGTRPFRSPHHTASGVALVGGGSHPRPGEISLAHHGVLFLDELPEFDRKVLEVLREPLESGHITISRAARQADFPARFQLVAAMNPCPCGYFGDSSGRCHCTPDQVRRYRGRISGPLLDRIDMHLEVEALPQRALLDSQPDGDASDAVQRRVSAARRIAMMRFGSANSQLDPAQLEQLLILKDDARKLLEQALTRLDLSARAYHRILKLARTIADLAGAEHIEATHIAEAIQYRCLDRPVQRTVGSY